MNIKEWLKELKDLDTLIFEKRQEMLRMWEAVTYSGVSYGERVQSTRNLNKRSDMICDIIDLEREIKGLENELKEKQAILMAQASTLENETQVKIIKLRYVDFKGWLDIAEELGKSKRWCLKLHKDAIEKLSYLLKFTSLS